MKIATKAQRHKGSPRGFIIKILGVLVRRLLVAEKYGRQAGFAPIFLLGKNWIWNCNRRLLVVE
ncbi:MAG: hypothetical protein QG657_5693 [Acidobacteriota bacterium]|nr:hypothetical protein [Acidobacteriota bacterium]